MSSPVGRSSIYMTCVPHVPFLSLQQQQKSASADFWNAYDERVREFDAFDPDLVIVFGGDHYSNVHLNLLPTFMIAHQAEAIDDCGGLPGKLDVPMALSEGLARFLINDGFDIAKSYALKVDHGFSNPLTFFLHNDIAGRPVLPIYINAISDPRPTMKRVRQFGEAVGRWVATLDMRVAILGTGGLSHETGTIFPQYHEAESDAVRDYIVHGGTENGITDAQWQNDISTMMHGMSGGLISGAVEIPVNADWDRKVLATMASGKLADFDDWQDVPMENGGGGAGGAEVRMWLAAVAAAQAAGGDDVVIDYHSERSTIAVGAAVIHAG